MNKEERERRQQETFKIARQIDMQIDHRLIFVGAHQSKGDRRQMTSADKDLEADTISLKLEIHFSSSDDRILQIGRALKETLERMGICATDSDQCSRPNVLFEVESSCR